MLRETNNTKEQFKLIRTSIVKRCLLATDRRPLLPYGTAIKHPVPDRVKPLFVISDIWAL